jgi:hypothetical protein
MRSVRVFSGRVRQAQILFPFDLRPDTVKKMKSAFQNRYHGKFLSSLMALLFGLGAHAEPTNVLSDAEIQGRLLAQKILSDRPAENLTNTGILQIRAGGRLTKFPVICETIITKSNWFNRYQATNGTNSLAVTTLTVVHSNTNQYFLGEKMGPEIELSGDRSLIPFVGSDFWLGDLGLEFFHWPEQRVLKSEFHRNCACTVLESTSPNPTSDTYSRVVCWIDNDSLGIVEAYAYDVKGRRLKNFYPKNLEKVNGQYRVESMVMENLQTESSSRLEFNN